MNFRKLGKLLLKPLFVGCIPFVLWGCFPEQITCACGNLPMRIQVSAQMDSPESASVTEDFLHGLSKKGYLPHLEFGVAQGKEIAIVYSKEATRKAVRDLWIEIDPNPTTPILEPISSKPEALVAAFQRFSDVVKDAAHDRLVVAYIITSGTKDPRLIAQLKDIAQALAKYEYLSNARLYVIGLQPETRLPLSQAFEPIEDIVEFAGESYHEWSQLINRF